MLAALRQTFTNKKVIESRAANALGLQVFRILLARGSLKLRRRTPPQEQVRRRVEALVKDGFTVIKNFLPDDTFERVKQEHAQAIERALRKDCINHDARGVETVNEDFLYGDDDKYPASVAHVLRNKVWVDIVKAHEARHTDELLFLWGRFKARFERARFVGDDGYDRVATATSNSDIHTDTFHTITKGFYYLRDTDRTNGAFVFLPRSHLFTAKRLAFEYKHSLSLDSGMRPRQDELDGMGYENRAMEFPANSLVIANAQGFHSRGSFEAGVQRDIVYVEYRSYPFR